GREGRARLGRDPHAEDLSGVLRQLRALRGAARVRRPLPEPPPHRPQRHAQVQQSGPLDAHGDGGRRQHRRRPHRQGECVGREYGRGLPRGEVMRRYLIAFALIAAFFTAAEVARPYYFFQDDNRDIFLPFYVHNYRAALDGQLAQFNFFQSLGKPHFASGQVAAFSPVPYLAIFLSSAIFGHVFAAVDILVLIYLLIGAAGMVFLGRRLGFSDSASIFAAVSWPITPFNMLTSQSWTTYPPVIGLMPWILA